MKQESFTMTLLFDYYGSLLTEKQQEYFDLYYNQDFSLSEIAEQGGISRQGVHDTITRAEAILRNMEEITACIARERAWNEAVLKIRSAAQELALHKDLSVRQQAQYILDAAASVYGE